MMLKPQIFLDDAVLVLLSSSQSWLPFTALNVKQLLDNWLVFSKSLWEAEN